MASSCKVPESLLYQPRFIFEKLANSLELLCHCFLRLKKLRLVARGASSFNSPRLRLIKSSSSTLNKKKLNLRGYQHNICFPSQAYKQHR